MKDDVFVVEVTRSDTEKVKFKLDFEPKPNGKTEEVGSFASYSSKFKELSTGWTTIAIGFFDLMPFLSEAGYIIADHDFEDQVLSFLRENSEEIEEFDEGEYKTERFTVSNRELPRAAKHLGRTSRIMKTAAIMKRSALTALLAEYEAFIFDLLSLCVEIRPEVFLDNEASIPLVDLSDYDSIDELKSAYVKQKLDDLLHRSSHKEVLEWIGKKFGVNLLSDTKLICEFVEVCQRRHLISHAGSRANRRYRRICEAEGCRREDILELGEEVVIDRDYLRRATARVFQVGFFTLHILWQKVISDVDGSDAAVLASSHDFLEYDLTKMARRVTKFSLERKSKRPHNRLHAYLVINFAQSFKFDPGIGADEKPDLVEKALERRDWSDRSPMMDLALACLRDEFDDIADKVEAAAKVGEHRLTYSDVFTYNIFREAIMNSNFMAGVEKAFGQVGKIAKNQTPSLPSPSHDD